MNISNEIERLDRLRVQGTLTEEEFREAKAKVISGQNGPAIQFGAVSEETVYGLHVNTWCMLMHLSQLLHFAGGIGFLVPIVMWAISKDNNSTADRHGASIINWLLTLVIALVVFGLLSVVIIGIPFLVIYVVLSVVFPIVGAIKAANGDFWPYPTSITFIRFDESDDRDSPATYL